MFTFDLTRFTAAMQQRNLSIINVLISSIGLNNYRYWENNDTCEISLVTHNQSSKYRGIYSFLLFVPLFI